MNEWKRVFLDHRRLGLLLLSVVLCLGAFLMTLLDDMTLGAIRRASSVNEYAAGLVEAWRDKPYDEMIRLGEAEKKRLLDVQDWYYPSAYLEAPFETEEEAEASVADIPDLADAMRRRDNNDFAETLNACYDAVEGLVNEANYLAGYDAYLAGIQSQAQIQSQTSLFGKPGSFAQRNLAATAEDFGELLGVETLFGNSRGLERWLAFDLGDYFHLAAIAVIVMSFLEERQRGLWPAVRATRGGRGRLGLTRIGILLSGSALATLLFIFLPFAVSMWLHGGWGDLGRPLQSVESFATCPLRISIAGWLVRFFALKIASGVLIGLLLWCVLGAIASPQFSVAVLGVTLAAEFALYEYLPVQSFMNILKYFNIFAYVHTSSLYTQYLNVDLFTFPVGIRALALWGLAVLGAGLGLWAVELQISRRPEGNRDHLSRLSKPVNRALDSVRSRLTVGGWEVYKSLIFQYGALLMVLVFVISGSLTFLHSDHIPSDTYYSGYLGDMEGPIDESTDDYLARARELARSGQDAAALLDALDRVEQRVTELRDRAEEGGYAPWVADEFEYDICYGPQSRNRQRLNAAIAILMTSLLTASLWPFEHQAGVVSMLRSTPVGRRRLFRRKVLTASLLAVFVWGCVYIREIVYFLYEYPRPATLSVPVMNLDSLARFPLKVTLSQYMAIVYALRLLMLIGTAWLSLAVGSLCPNVRTALLAAAAVLGTPALLTALGAEFFKWVSPVVPVSSAELLWGLGSGKLLYALPWLVYLAAASAGMYLIHRRWTRTSSV